MKWKKGDTLVEVAFAIGIFSLVAVTVISVVSASTSAAQAALENTLTREDIDSQAEALRFIHDSYVNGSQSAVKYTDNVYERLWEKITSLAYNDGDTYSGSYPEVGLRGQNIKKYEVTACSNLYNGTSGMYNLVSSPGTKSPFIIDIRKLSSTNPDEIISLGPGNSKFRAATTFPRILYGDVTSEDLYTQTQGGNNNIAYVEGLYIIAVKGKAIDVDPTSNAANRAAYYDFYIRSCFMPTNIDRASTVSTMIRLYDPAIIH